MKRQKLAELRAEKEQKKLLKGSNGNGVAATLRPLSAQQQQQPATLKARPRPSPTYSDIVGTATKRHVPVGGKRAALARRPADDFKVVEVSARAASRCSAAAINAATADPLALLIAAGPSRPEELQTRLVGTYFPSSALLFLAVWKLMVVIGLLRPATRDCKSRRFSARLVRISSSELFLAVGRCGVFNKTWFSNKKNFRFSLSVYIRIG